MFSKTPEEQVADIDCQIKDLEAKRQGIIDSIKGRKLNRMLEPRMGKWVIIHGWGNNDEATGKLSDTGHYRIFKLVAVNKWEGDKSFRVVAQHILMVSPTCEIIGAYVVDPDMPISNIEHCTIIEPEDAKSIYDKVIKKQSHTIKKVMDALEKDMKYTSMSYNDVVKREG